MCDVFIFKLLLKSWRNSTRNSKSRSKYRPNGAAQFGKAPRPRRLPSPLPPDRFGWRRCDPTNCARTAALQCRVDSPFPLRLKRRGRATPNALSNGRRGQSAAGQREPHESRAATRGQPAAHGAMSTTPSSLALVLRPAPALLPAALAPSRDSGVV
jgi:hypothetical protein